MSIKLSFEDPVQRDTNRVILSRTPDKNPNPALGYSLDPIPKLDRGCDEFSGRQTNHDICYVSYSSKTNLVLVVVPVLESKAL